MLAGERLPAGISVRRCVYLAGARHSWRQLLKQAYRCAARRGVAQRSGREGTHSHCTLWPAMSLQMDRVIRVSKPDRRESKVCRAALQTDLATVFNQSLKNIP